MLSAVVLRTGDYLTDLFLRVQKGLTHNGRGNSTYPYQTFGLASNS